MSFLDLVFDDKRLSICIVTLWTIIVLTGFHLLNIPNSDFMTLGPSNHTKFMTVEINTWEKWGMLSVATFLNSCVADFMSDAIIPWIQNTVQDHKTKFLPYNKWTCFLICQFWDIYCHIMSVFNVSLVFSQVDFLLIRLAADLMVNQITIYKFIKHKIVDQNRYNLWSEEKLAYVQMNPGMDMFAVSQEMIQPLNTYINNVDDLDNI